MSNPVFTKRHYDRICEVLRDSNEHNLMLMPKAGLLMCRIYDDVIAKLCIMFEKDNENFDSERFMKQISKK